MRLLQILILLFLMVTAKVGNATAQDRESLKQLLKLDEIKDSSQLKLSPETGIGLGYPSKYYLSGYGFDNYLLRNMNLQSPGVWKFDQNKLAGNVSYQYMTMWNYNPMLYGITGNAGYFGLYGTSLRQVNDKLFIGTSMLIPDKIRTTTGPFSGNSFNSSIFVGYKFSDKFSIKAGMNIQRYENPWMNGGYAP